MDDVELVRPHSRGEQWTATPSLGDLLAARSLRLVLRLGDPDTGLRQVRWVHTTELLDPRPYLRGGELVCTVGASLSDPASCGTFVAALAAAGVASLCFGTGDVHEQIPQALIDACRLHKLPLLELPRGAPFLALSEHLAERRVAAEAAEFARSEQLLARLLAGLRADSAISDLLTVAAEELGGRLQLVTDGQPGRPEGPAGVDEPVTAIAPAGEGARLVWTGVGPAPGSMLLRQIGHVLDVARHERSVEQTLRRAQIGHLLLLVADGLADAAAVTPALHDAGLGSQPLTVSAWPAGAGTLLEGRLPDALLGEGPEVAFSVSVGVEPLRRAAEVLGLPCGYGSAVPAAELARGIAEARAALELARRRGSVIGPSGLTSLDGLLEQQPVRRLAPFVDQLIQPILGYDRRHGTGHMDTLRVFLRQDGSVQRTATDQYLHVNTVRHRLARVHELTGRNPLVFADRVALAIAVWTYDRYRRAAGRSG